MKRLRQKYGIDTNYNRYNKANHDAEQSRASEQMDLFSGLAS